MLTLFGYGITTKAIAKKFGKCRIYDDKFSAATFDKYGNEFLASELFNPDNSILEVTSPGIPPTHPLIQKAKNLVSEYDLFASTMPYSVWVTGTNGKTTTTDMMGHLLKKRGGVTGGNIGTPLATLDEKAPLWILETSSFTLHYTNIAVPNIYVILPVTPDHISWHGSFEAYEEAKLKPLRQMQEGEVVILPEKYKDVPTKAMKITYENAKDLAEYFDIELHKVHFREPFLTDALLALGVTKILFDEIDYDRINSYHIGKHRMEEFVDRRGRLWINDSKATNPDATIAALESYHEQKIHLILGGDDKGAGLDALFEKLKDMDVEIYAIGANLDRLRAESQKYKLPFYACHTLEKAVSRIDQNHDTDSIAMLSPAAASLDQFSSYAHRGEDFFKFINNLS
ncbi:MAG: UDP-N-acetylmuramoyl-L-alanine--D-glutamate ligase [Sulfurospirillum sp.]|nr:MAG: UDP-N-acetylmuramoyl-L-alanine--D-glutamate ligase [Sulfurospirillum sp.]